MMLNKIAQTILSLMLFVLVQAAVASSVNM